MELLGEAQISKTSELAEQLGEAHISHHMLGGYILGFTKSCQSSHGFILGNR